MFFALWPDPSLAGRLAELAGNCAGQFGGRASRRETLHLTLAFVGNVGLDKLDVLRRAGDNVAASAFCLHLDHLGYWAHNRILWAACDRAEGLAGSGLGSLVRSLQQSLREQEIVVAGGSRHFLPHLTLVRKVVADAPELPVFSPLEWPCHRFLLVRSRLSPAGAAYEILAEWPLS